MNRGFTLLDLLLVLLILAILGLAVVPQFDSMIRETKLNEAAAEVVSALQYAGVLSIQYQRPFGLHAEVEGNCFKVFDSRYGEDPDPHHDALPPVDSYGIVLDPVDKKWFTKDLDDMENYAGVRFDTIPAGGEVLFYPDGHSAFSDHVLVLTFADRKRTIRVDGMTGRIELQ